MKNILMVAIQPQRFLDQLHFAEELNIKAKGNINIQFFIGEKVYDLYKLEIDKLAFEIINDLEFEEQENNNYVKSNNRLIINLKKSLNQEQKNQMRKYLNFLKLTKLYSRRLLKQEKLYLEKLELEYVKIKKLVIDNNINIFLINGDRHLGLEPVFLKISKILNIPSIIPYLVDFADKERILLSGYKTEKIKKGFFISKYILDSQQNLNYKIVQNRLFYPHITGNALQQFGVLTSNPYVMGCGESDILCLNNKSNVEKYIRNGVENDKIHLIGDISFDRLYNNFVQREATKKEILNKYSLNKSKEIIIIALPQLAEHRLLSWDDHWKEINFLMEELSTTKKNILISLHPKMDKLKYDFLEFQYNCKILNERLAEVLPIADIFVATFSSTVVWAVLCGIKTIVVDFYDFNYTMYDFLRSIIIVNKKDEFREILKNIFKKYIKFEEDWKLLSKDTVFDGNVIKRYIDLFEKLS